MPTSMCSIPISTGIKEIDEYHKKFGYPLFEVKLDHSEGVVPI
ncbi:hypothetical protein LCGC14_2444150, partial [marine sediment metagenome]